MRYCVYNPATGATGAQSNRLDEANEYAWHSAALFQKERCVMDNTTGEVMAIYNNRGEETYKTRV